MPSRSLTELDNEVTAYKNAVRHLQMAEKYLTEIKCYPCSNQVTSAKSYVDMYLSAAVKDIEAYPKENQEL